MSHLYFYTCLLFFNIFEHYFIQKQYITSFLLLFILDVVRVSCSWHDFFNRCAVNATPQQLSQTEQAVGDFLKNVGRSKKERKPVRPHVVEVRAPSREGVGPRLSCVGVLAFPLLMRPGWVQLSVDPVRSEFKSSNLAFDPMLLLSLERFGTLS